jgi:hypothetical protein
MTDTLLGMAGAWMLGPAAANDKPQPAARMPGLRLKRASSEIENVDVSG